MNYYDSAEELSNSCVVDILLVDSISDDIENERVSKSTIVNLSRLIEAFVLSSEVVVKDLFLTIEEPFYAYDYEYEFTAKWIETFLNNNVIRAGHERSASSLLTAEFCVFDKNNVQYDKEINNMMVISDTNYSESEDYDLHDLYRATYPAKNLYAKLERLDQDILEHFEGTIEERIYAREIWNKMTSHYGIPFLCENEKLCSFNANKPTNISLDLYRQIIECNATYFNEISRYLGPTYFNLPPLLGIVLKECKSISDLPTATMTVRDKFTVFRFETTELEFQLRTSKIKDQIKILQKKQRAFDNIASKFSAPKRYVQSRVLDVAQTLSIKGGLSQAIKDARNVKLERDGLLLIPGYYDLWKATIDIEQALPELKRVFGNTLTNDFFC